MGWNSTHCVACTMTCGIMAHDIYLIEPMLEDRASPSLARLPAEALRLVARTSNTHACAQIARPDTQTRQTGWRSSVQASRQTDTPTESDGQSSRPKPTQSTPTRVHRKEKKMYRFRDPPEDTSAMTERVFASSISDAIFSRHVL
jgi:hypothetical protein